MILVWTYVQYSQYIQSLYYNVEFVHKKWLNIIFVVNIAIQGLVRRIRFLICFALISKMNLKAYLNNFFSIKCKLKVQTLHMQGKTDYNL